MCPDVPFERRHPVREWRGSVAAAVLHPAAQPLGFFLVGGVADNNGDALLPLDPIRLAARFTQRHEDIRDVFVLDERVAQGVGDEQARWIRPAGKGVTHEFLQLGH